MLSIEAKIFKIDIRKVDIGCGSSQIAFGSVQPLDRIVRGTAFASADIAPDDCLRYFETAAEGEFAGSEGRILHIGRVFRPRAFQSVRPALYQGRWLVLATQFGQMIVRSRILRPEGVAVAVGGYLRYNGCRLDLYAVV